MVGATLSAALVAAAVFALWMARDDAHIAAWRAEGLGGPQLDLLTSLWRGEAHMLPELTAAFEQLQNLIAGECAEEPVCQTPPLVGGF